MFHLKKPDPDQNAHCLLKDVGINRINSQHLRLASYAVEFNQLIDELTRRDPNNEDWRHIDALFSRVSRFVETHFREEEELMWKHGYPDYDGHKKQHEKFEKELAGIQSKINNRKIAFSGKFGAMLWEWLYHHINVEDYKYRDFFHGKGLS